MTTSTEASREDASHSNPDLLGKDSVRVARADFPAEGVVRLTLVDPARGRLPDWTPGSHIDVVVPQPDGSNAIRQYSLCGDRWDAYSYQIAVLREPVSRGGSIYLHDELAEGDLIRIGTPRNHFSLASAQRYEFIAGGIGITPIMTMIDAAERMGVDWRLLYGGRTRASMAFLDELAPYGDRVMARPQDEFGHLDLSEYAEPVEGTKIYSCGPEPLLAAIESATSAWPTGTVRFERFAAVEQAPPVRSGPFTVELARSGKTITVTPSESVLQAVAEAGSPVLASCSMGVCGTCEVGVLAGVPDHRDSLLSDAERAENDRMFVCVSRAVTERLVLDL
ncbi:PDR/VanB family oxidoreductase [Aeromicrobium choanae]|uniref:Ferredoxin-NADP reductase n=1 Tax=Aeromicrobium choanae TaxID=1736691 RepID=A0A1T4Z5V1_9ACTN|nr:PDR/VanB family oxidoreductase [Aeromicrobium choanae]SKB08915.1 Ferredoxin-NADP reductase [Aeromicrobium choanae]